MKMPQSRVENILRATIDGTEYNKLPLSRVEELLIELKNSGGGGGGGTNDYNQLINKPSINNEVLQGNRTSDDIDVAPEPRIDGENLIFG